MSQDPVHIKEEIIRAYRIVMSRGDDIQIDPEELNNVIDGIQSGMPVKVKRGIFNPSFYVSIIEDEKRVRSVVQFNRSVMYTKNDHELQCPPGQKCHHNEEEMRFRKLPELQDMFSGVPLKISGTGESKKLLN